MRFAVLTFPGTWSDRDCRDVLRDVLDQEAELVWHQETDLSRYDAIVVPGGFSYGDYLRCGAIARFSPVMEAVKREAERGKIVFGSCNGFQILCEAGLLPGALMRNDVMQFRCQPQALRIETSNTAFTNTVDAGTVLTIPISHGEGNYYCDDETLAQLEAQDRIVARYCDAARPGDAGVEPQRLARQHRRHPQRKPQRLRHDAPPRARLRGPPRRHRRPRDLAVDAARPGSARLASEWK